MSPRPHVELSAVVRLEADYLPDGPRAELLRFADELEDRSRRIVVSRNALLDAISSAETSAEADETGAGTGADESMPSRLRRRARRAPEGTDRDALLRYADELEEKGDPSLVSPAIFRAALRAHGAGEY